MEPQNALSYSAISSSPLLTPPNTKIVSYDTDLKVYGTHDKPIIQLFKALQNSYQYFVKNLFDKPLPPVILALNKRAKSKGYYKPAAWVDELNKKIPEINLNPELLWQLPEIIMATLVHEICHHYHYFYGKPGNNGYHNNEFAEIMLDCGLACSHTGKPGGKSTGYHMSHFIIPGGRFQKVFNEMPEFFLAPFRPTHDKVFVPFQKNNITRNLKLKIKYRCSDCNLSVWGKPNLNVRCGNCNIQLTGVNDFGN